MTNRTSLTIIQLNDSHAYFDLHQETFWQGGQAVYRLAGGYARIATIVKKIRAANPGHTLFCDCGDTLHGTYPAQKTQGEALNSYLEFIRSRCHDGSLGICVRSSDLQAVRSKTQLSDVGNQCLRSSDQGAYLSTIQREGNWRVTDRSRGHRLQHSRQGNATFFQRRALLHTG